MNTTQPGRGNSIPTIGVSASIHQPDKTSQNNHTMWWQLWRGLSPRRRLRVDPTGHHDYDVSAPFTRDPPPIAGEPRVELAVSSTGRRRAVSWSGPVPYAVYLAGSDHRYRLLCLDLDATAGPDVVAEDLARVTELLADAGARYTVAESGPTGGRHVWLSIPAGADPERVATMARGLAAVLPSLDTGMLRNPATGCARPIGAPHRRGGTSRLDTHHHPDPAAALQALQDGNPPTLPDMVLALLPPAVRDSATRPTAPGRTYRPVTEEAGAPRLSGERRALSPAVADLIGTRPTDRDASAHLWRILIGAALARWTRADIEALATQDAAVGLEHLHSRNHRGVRHPRTASATTELLTRQWARAVNRAAGLPPTNPADHTSNADEDPRVAEVTATVDAVLTAAAAMPWRWAIPGGPADERALHAVCLLALACCSTELALDVRRWAELAGVAASTAALAARRLTTPDPIRGAAWLQIVHPAAGTRATVWRLLPPPVNGSPTTGPGEPDSSASVQLSGPPSMPVDQHHPRTPDTPTRPVDTSRTQGRSPRPPTANPPQIQGLRNNWQSYLASYAARIGHDAWHPHGGLGHHTARTHSALVTGADTLDQIVSRTGYTRTTVRHHLRRLTALGLADTSAGRITSGRARLDAVAAQLGTVGAAAARHTRHTADREIHRWWLAELNWRRAPRSTKARVPAGWRPAPGQRALPIAPAGPLCTYGRFPTIPAGRRQRADFAAARHIVHKYLAGSVAAAPPAAAA